MITEAWSFGSCVSRFSTLELSYRQNGVFDFAIDHIESAGCDYLTE
jgi:hypothetical protein